MRKLLFISLITLLAGCAYRSQPIIVANKQNGSGTSSLSSENWQIYENKFFTIEYPVGGKSTGTNEFVIFAPSSTDSSAIDPPWSVEVFEKEKFPTTQDVIDLMAIGTQFPDRREIRKEIVIDGKSALLLTVSTKKYDDWIHRTAIIEQPNQIITISNGANFKVDQKYNFEKFYKSIRLKN